jgi:hypothetical protein
MDIWLTLSFVASLMRSYVVRNHYLGSILVPEMPEKSKTGQNALDHTIGKFQI